MKEEVARTGLLVPNSPYGFCGRKATLKKKKINFSAQELCERGGGKNWGSPSLTVPTLSVDVKQH